MENPDDKLCHTLISRQRRGPDVATASIMVIETVTTDPYIQTAAWADYFETLTAAIENDTPTDYDNLVTIDNVINKMLADQHEKDGI